MSGSEFTPSNLFDKNKEKDWAANLGMMDWDTTKIVFTKRSLIEFLKSIDITVDPHFANIQKLPRYAEFGKLATAGVSSPNPSNSGQSNMKSSLSGRIFSQDDDDALASAPPVGSDQAPSTQSEEPASPPQHAAAEEEVGFKFPSQPKPSRRVRTAPGGADSISSLWDSKEEEEFKPTRKVRQQPGGQDNINGIF